MGWEIRHGRRYLYRNRRVNATPVKEYVAADGPVGTLLAFDLAEQREQRATERERTRRSRTTDRARADELLRLTSCANAELRAVAEGLLHAVGYHKHHRGE